MFISYIVTNDGEGSYWIGDEIMDLTCDPSECLWLVPGTYEEGQTPTLDEVKRNQNGT